MAVTYEPVLENLKQAIRTWVKDVTGLNTVIWANQMIARPDLPYVMLNILEIPIEGGQTEKQLVESGSDVYKLWNIDNYQIMLSINIYTAQGTTDAFFYLQKLNQSVTINYYYEYFRSNGLALVEKSRLRNIDEQLGDRWEKRAQQDYIFRFRAKTIEDIEIIETVQMTGIYVADEEEIEDISEIEI